MEEKTWLGALYLKNEGYKIILKSLNHYKKRLKTIGNSPELKNAAAMFGPLLQQEATKTIPKIEETIEQIQEALQDSEKMINVKKNIAFLEKSLNCYQSDIQKAHDTGEEYFVKLINDSAEIQKDVELIKTALKRIKEFE